MKKFSLPGQDRSKRANRINTSATQTLQTDESFAAMKYPTEASAEDAKNLSVKTDFYTFIQ